MAKFNPCTDYCYVRHNKQYSEECIGNCDYADTVVDMKKFKEKFERYKKKYNELRGMIEADDGK